MEPLVQDMVQTDPTKRHNMEERSFGLIRYGRALSGWKLCSQIVDDEEDALERVTRTVSHWIRRVAFVARRVPRATVLIHLYVR